MTRQGGQVGEGNSWRAIGDLRRRLNEVQAERDEARAELKAANGAARQYLIAAHEDQALADKYREALERIVSGEATTKVGEYHRFLSPAEVARQALEGDE